MKYVRWTILFVCLAFFVSCGSVVADRERPLPTKTTVFIDVDFSHRLCARKGDDTQCVDLKIGSTFGTGVVVSGTTSGDNVVMTAGHVCLGPEGLDAKYTVTDYAGRKFVANLRGATRSPDVCLLNVANLRLMPATLALRGPRVGEEVVNIAAPRRIFGPNLVPVFHGEYRGHWVEEDAPVMDLYILPAAGGSSGSPIFNKYGHLVGMLVAGWAGIPVVLAVRYEDIKQAYLSAQ